MTKQIENRVIHVRAEKSYTRARAAKAAAFKAMESGQDWIIGWTGDIQEHEGRFFPVLEQVEKVEVEIHSPPETEQTETGTQAKKGAKSNIESPVRSAWTIAYMLAGEKRRVVVAAMTEAGITYNTACTQYQRWHQARKANHAPV